MNETEGQAAPLQEFLERLAAGERAEGALAGLGDDAELADLAKLTLQLASLLPTAPRPAYRAQLQVRLQDLMAGERRSPSRRWLRLRLRLLPRVAALAVAVALAFGSAVVVSAGSLPGDALYGVKLATERTQLVLAIDPAARARVQLGIAGRRLAEVQRLIDRGMVPPASVIDGLLDARGAAAIEAAAARDAALMQEVERRAAEARQVVAGLIDEAPGEARQLLERARAALNSPDPLRPDVAIPTPSATVSVAATERGTPTAWFGNEAPPGQDLGAAEATATLADPSVTVAAAALPTTTPTSPPGLEAAATRPKPVDWPPTPVPPTATEEFVAPTVGPTTAAILTQRAVELTREAEASPTPTRRPSGRHVDPTTVPEPTWAATPGAGGEVPTATPVPTPTVGAAL